MSDIAAISAAAPASPSAAPPTTGAPAASPAVDSTGASSTVTNLIADATDAPASAPTEPTAEAAAATNEPATFAEYPTIKLPEGVEKDSPELGQFMKDFKEAGLSEPQVQALIDKYSGKLVPVETLQKTIDASNKLWNDTQQAWQNSVKSDPEVGGQNMEKNLGAIATLINNLGGKEAAAIKQAFGLTGAGNNPDIIRFMHRAATALNATGRTINAGGVPNPSFSKAAGTFYGPNAKE